MIKSPIWILVLILLVVPMAFSLEGVNHLVTTNSIFNSNDDDTRYAQTFIVNTTATYKNLSVWVTTEVGTDDFDIFIYPTYAGTGDPDCSDDIANLTGLSNGLTQNNWHDFQFSSGFTLTANTNYSWVWYNHNTGSNYHTARGSANDNSYTEGQAMTQAGGCADAGWTLINKDLAFRLQYEEAAVPVLANTLKLFDEDVDYLPTPVENEPFWITANFTVDDIPDITGQCNFTSNNISIHHSVHNASNYTLVTSLDSVSITGTLTDTSAVFDVFQFEVCRSTATSNLEVYVNKSLFRTIPSASIPICGSGTHFEKNLSDVNVADTVYNITLKCSQCNGALKQITVLTDDESETLRFNREFTTHSMPLSYNATSSVYENRSHLHEFRNAESTNTYINTTCNDTRTDTLMTITGELLSIDILSIDDVDFLNGMSVESSPNTTILIDVYGDFVNTIVFNVTYEGGELIKTSSTETLTLNQTELNQTGIYLIRIAAQDDEGNWSNQSGNFIINDTISPVIIWGSPSDTNTSYGEVNFSLNLLINFSDTNLFAYDVFIRDPSDTTRFRYNATDLNTTLAIFSASFVPTVTGTWSVFAQVSDDHTAERINDYRYTIRNQDIEFNFTNSVGHLDYNDKTVLIRRVSGKDIRSIDVIKQKDRYNFKYRFFTNAGDQYQDHVFRVRCENIKYRSQSDYISHFVCPTINKWIDFETKDIISYRLRKCGKDCFDVRMRTKNVEYLEFSSIGGLNMKNETVQFSVTSPVPVNTSLAVNTCPSTLAGHATLWLIALIIGFFIILGFSYKIPVIGVLGSMGMIIFAFTLVGCSGFMGYMVGLAGLMLVLVFLFMIS